MLIVNIVMFQKARSALLSQLGIKTRDVGGEVNLGPIDLTRHSYVKLTELTEKIGFASNQNLLAFADLKK